MKLLDQLPHIELGPRAYKIPRIKGSYADEYDPNKARRDHIIERWKGDTNTPIQSDELLWWHRALKPFLDSGIKSGEACSVSLANHTLYGALPTLSLGSHVYVNPSIVCRTCGEHIWWSPDGEYILCTYGVIADE